MNLKIRARVIDSWKGNDPKYPNTAFTLLDEQQKGQIKLSVPPVVSDRLNYGQLYDLDCVVAGQVSNLGLRLTYVSGTIDLVDPVNVPAPVKKTN